MVYILLIIPQMRNKVTQISIFFVYMTTEKDIVWKTNGFDLIHFPDTL